MKLKSPSKDCETGNLLKKDKKKKSHTNGESKGKLNDIRRTTKRKISEEGTTTETSDTLDSESSPNKKKKVGKEMDNSLTSDGKNLSGSESPKKKKKKRKKKKGENSNCSKVQDKTGAANKMEGVLNMENNTNNKTAEQTTKMAMKERQKESSRVLVNGNSSFTCIDEEQSHSETTASSESSFSKSPKKKKKANSSKSLEINLNKSLDIANTSKSPKKKKKVNDHLQMETPDKIKDDVMSVGLEESEINIPLKAEMKNNTMKKKHKIKNDIGDATSPKKIKFS